MKPDFDTENTTQKTTNLMTLNHCIYKGFID